MKTAFPMPYELEAAKTVVFSLEMVSVKERKPDHENPVLIVFYEIPKPQMTIGSWSNHFQCFFDHSIDCDEITGTPTHWAEIPIHPDLEVAS